MTSMRPSGPPATLGVLFRSSLLRLIVRRVALAAVTLLVVSLIVFFCVALLPGDMAQALLGQNATPDSLRALRSELGLDRPAYIRYFQWLKGILLGDLGYSLSAKRKVSDLVLWRLNNTLFLAAYTAVLSIPISLALGLVTALHVGSKFDNLANASALFFISLPEFLIGYIVILILSVNLSVFPSISTAAGGGTGTVEFIYRATLPAFSLVLASVAHMMRVSRASIVEILDRQYIEMARLKGLSIGRILFVHALPNALPPIINVVALNLASLVSGVVVIETVFVYPGLGQLLVDAVVKRDIQLVQACCMIFASVYILVNLLADVLSIMATPRIMHPK